MTEKFHSFMLRHLFNKWMSLRKFSTLDTVDAYVFESEFIKLISCYMEDNRHYHNVSHLANMTKFIDSFFSSEKTSDHTVYLAAFYHDVVYVPASPVNEEESADYAVKSLRKLDLSEDIIDRVKLLVLATKTHTSDEDMGYKLLIDADLSELAKPPLDYIKSSNHIRKEYSIFSDDEFYAGRLKWANGMLKRDHIFYTEFGRIRLENIARNNLTREIAEIEEKFSGVIND